MVTTSSPAVGSSYAQTPVQKAALGIGIALLIVGILGFVPGITGNYDELLLAGYESRALLLGVFQVSVLHNLLHLLCGVGGTVAAHIVGWARKYLLLGSLFYAVLWVYGLAVGPDSTANIFALNTADNWLNFVLFVGMFGLGLLPPARPRPAASQHRG